jgi:hypothetical protein
MIVNRYEVHKMKLAIFMLLVIFANVSQAEKLSYEQIQYLAKQAILESNDNIALEQIEDITNFCPNYNELYTIDKINFFAHLLASMSQFESVNKTDATFLENNGNLSTGLLQISYKSISPIYRQNGCNMIYSPEDLKDPYKNLQCGLGILTTLIRRTGYIARSNHVGASAYWSTLRTPYKVYLRSMNKSIIVGKRRQVIALLRKNFSECFVNDYSM